MLELLRDRFVGTHELRREMSKILDAIREEGGEVVVTQQGKPVAVLMDIEKYLEMNEAIAESSDPRFLAQLLESQREFEAGGGVPVAEVLAKRGLADVRGEAVE